MNDGVDMVSVSRAAARGDEKGAGEAGVKLVGDTLIATKDVGKPASSTSTLTTTILAIQNETTWPATVTTTNEFNPNTNTNTNTNTNATMTTTSTRTSGLSGGSGGREKGRRGSKDKEDVLVLPRFVKNQRIIDINDHHWCCDDEPAPVHSSSSDNPSSSSKSSSSSSYSIPKRLFPNSVGVIGATGQHLGARDHMEDRHRIVYNREGDLMFRAIAGVFDGHGGEEIAHYLCKNLHLFVQASAVQYARVNNIDISALAPNLRVSTSTSSTFTSTTTSTSSISSSSSSTTPSSSTSSSSSSSSSSSVSSSSSSSPQSAAAAARQLDYRAILHTAFDALEDGALQLAREIGCRDGSTASIVLIGHDDGMLYCANTGDSRTVLCRDGSAVALSEDHKPFNKGEKERIERAGGKVEPVMVDRQAFCCWKAKKVPQGADRLWPGGFSVSRAIGDIDYKDIRRRKTKSVGVLVHSPDITITSRNEKDQFVIMATDGLWDVVGNQEACEFVLKELKKTKEFDPSVVAQKLADKAYSKGSEDNVSCAILFFTEKV